MNTIQRICSFYCSGVRWSVSRLAELSSMALSSWTGRNYYHHLNMKPSSGSNSQTTYGEHIGKIQTLLVSKFKLMCNEILSFKIKILYYYHNHYDLRLQII